ncbi:hypothetical protein SAMN05444397_106311 [Flavobacterium aquidurense]|uniref:hypothetical protein n=1 Tax=Flavobacterium frigidimaris TaxID=262320 RepID=UPI000896F952|nr:hypothetical protein [Flavobacterium frigidimaris]SDZ42687.1 hypothetical protein SAMN05444397_106311 [Flavobacterium aquidurense]
MRLFLGLEPIVQMVQSFFELKIKSYFRFSFNLKSTPHSFSYLSYILKTNIGSLVDTICTPQISFAYA